MLENTQTILADIHMLATDKSSKICLNPLNNTLALMIDEYVEGQLLLHSKPQHLYATTDEEIKEGDWYLSSSGGIMSQHNGSELLPDGWKKIVATTNSELWVTNIPNHNDFDSIVDNIPKIPTTFLQPYVDAYNSGKSIKQVKLEQVDNGYEVDMEGRGGMDEGDTCWMPKLELKLKSNGSVIIHRVEKTITFKEMVEFVMWYIGVRQEPVVNAYNRWMVEK